ncbi:MAG: RluA family pseudouridine synthase [Rickettsiales bacterium]|jgi:23S rRNA pseudouridine1911/1915/1917 synthase|nr:RluA family pseudouridine synthase [Rickettsiales bacterium]
MNYETRNFVANESDAGLRLDKFLANQMPEFSRSEIQKFCIAKFLKAEGKRQKAKLSEKIKSGDEFIVEVPNNIQPTAFCPLPSALASLDILFEDSDIIVINKPRGVAMYPGAGRESDTLVQMVLSHTTLSAIGDSDRPGVVHRLDKDTSGAVVLAKSDAAHRVLTKMFAEHNLTRKYITFVWGVPNWEGADISGNIGRSTKNRQKMTILKLGGREAKTHADVMNAWARENISQLKCTLFTGRTHQIRVHLSAHGFPVLCDPVYGKDGAHLGSVKNPELLEFLRGRRGQMLHAEVLDFAHPITGEALHFKARLPADMQELKEILND